MGKHSAAAKRRFAARQTDIVVHFLKTFIKWLLVASITGAVGGVVGSLFHKAVELATHAREENLWLILLLPVGGVVIVAVYKLFKLGAGIGTDEVIDSIRSGKKVPPAMAQLIFIGTFITHLFGGSAGREGAALQLGGSIGVQIASALKLDERDIRLATMCGMSSVFSALFGTPLTATIFAMGVISVGIMYYSGFVPCIVSSLVAYQISIWFGLEPVRYILSSVPALSPVSVFQIGLLAAGCALVSIIFCLSLRTLGNLTGKWIKNEYLRAAAGGIAVILLTFIVQTTDYNGAGMDVIARAVGGEARPEAFVLKIIFTAVTLAAGFKGGEIVPTFFIGATFGCVVAPLVGIDAGFGAAIGMVALFCGVSNCPVASIILSVEMFGSEGILLFAFACAVSYLLSGYYSLYGSQKIVYSKTRAEFINKDSV